MATTNDDSLTLAQAIAQFLADPTTGTGYTLQTYGVGLKRLLAYVKSAHAAADQAPASLISVPFALRWITWLLDDQGISERTLLTYLAGFSRFVRFLHNRGLANLSADDVLRLQTELRQVRRVHRPPRRQVRAPSEDDVAALVRAARGSTAVRQDFGVSAARLSSPKSQSNAHRTGPETSASGSTELAEVSGEPLVEGLAEVSAGTDGAERGELRRLRDIAMLELLRSSGMRVGELVALRRRDQEEGGRGAGLRRLRVMGKGRKERWAYADADAWAAIRAYLQARATLDGNTGKPLGGLPLFARHDKGAGSAIRPLTTRSVQIIIEGLARRAGLEEQGISPHSLRHYFATRVLRVTGNLAIVQDLLDHRSPETTRIYAEVDEAQMRAAHEQAFGQSARDLAPSHRGDDSG